MLNNLLTLFLFQLFQEVITENVVDFATYFLHEELAGLLYFLLPFQVGQMIKRKSPIYTLELSLKSDFQHSATKSNNKGRPTVETG